MKLSVLKPFRSFFARFLLTYVALLSIPLLLAVFISNELLGEVQNTVEESQLALLRQTRSVVEQSIDDLEWRVFQIAGHPRIGRLTTEYRSSGTINLSLVREIISYLHTYTLYSSNLRSTFYIYLKQPEIILTPYAMYRHDDFTDRRTFLQIEGTSLENWHDLIFSSYFRRKFLPSRRVTIEDFTNQSMIPYIQSMPVGTSMPMSSINGALVFFLGEEEFSSLLQNIVLPEGGWAYISNESNEIITSISNNPSSSIKPVEINSSTSDGLIRTTVNDEDMFVAYARSDKGWTYVAVLPVEPILSTVMRLQHITVMTLSLSILFTMLAASLISYKRARPLQNLIDSLRDVSGLDISEVSSIQALNSGVRNLISESRHLQDQLQRQEAFHENLLVSRLLQGSFRNNNEMQSFLEYLDIELHANCFAAVILSMSGFETLETVEMINQMNQSKVVLKDLLHREIGDRVLIYDSNEESLSLIAMSRYSGSCDFAARLFTQLQIVMQKFEDVYHGRLEIGAGSPRTDILSISDSYEEARLALSASGQNHETPLVVYSEDLKNEQTYYFPIELEIKISNAARAGDVEALEAVFDNFISENFSQRKVSAVQIKYLYHELFGTLQKLMASIKTDLPEALSVDELRDPEDINSRDSVQLLIEKFYIIASHMNSAKRSHNQKLISEIVRYIRANYAEHDLGLYVVASKFSITESYLSFFFKEQLGENFSTFVEKVRIEKAVELLKHTESGIMEIAEEVGYNSDKTFRRVFKKVKGLSPSDYRRELAMRTIL